MGKRMGYGQFDLTLDVVADVLGLPLESRIISIVGDVGQQTLRRSVTVVVQHPDLPEVVEGADPARLSPQLDGVPGLRMKLVDWGM